MRAPATIAVTGLAAWSLPAAACRVAPLSRALGIPRDRIAHGPVACLTFDDGPHPQGTPAVLEELAAAGARATFFLVGEQVERFPAVAARIAAEGHEIALHCQRHRNQLRLGPRALVRDLERGALAIAEATGVRPRLYRPPYGIFSVAGLAAVRRRGLEALLWSRWGRDWRSRATARSIAADAAGGIRAGDVVLLHDGDAYSARASWRATAAALPAILAAIAAAGLRTEPAGFAAG